MSNLAATATAVETNAAAAAGTVQLIAPPFPGRVSTPAPPGFWIAAGNRDVWSGGVVMQMGTQPHSPATAPTAGQLYVGYQWQGVLEPGFYTFQVRFDVVSVSRGTRGGGSLQTCLFTKLEGPGISRPSYKFLEVSGGGICYMAESVFAIAAGTYALQVGGFIGSFYQGSQDPYAEIILRRTEVVRSRGFAGSQVQALGLEAEQEAGFTAADEPQDLIVEEVSLEKLAKERLANLRFDA